MSCFAILVSIRQTKIVRIGAQLLVPVVCDQEVVLEAQSPTARPVNSRLDCQHHPFANRTCPRLMCKWWLMRASTDTMTNGMRWLARVPTLCKSCAHQAIHLRKTCSIVRESNRFVEHT